MDLEYTIKLRQNLASNWTATNPTLAQGEVGFETNTGRLKTGDGSTPWISLPYNIVTRADIGAPNGVVPLNDSGEIDPGYITQVATATTTAFTPFSTVSATNVQAAIQEVFDEREPVVATSDAEKFYRGNKTFDKITTIDVNVSAARKIGNPTFVDTQSEVNTYVWSSGIINGCDISNNFDGTVDITSGSAILRSSASHDGTMYAVEVSAASNLTLLEDSTNYVYLDYNAGVPQFQTSSSRASVNGLNKTLAYLIYRHGVELHIVDARKQNLDFGTRTRNLFLDFSTFIHANGGSMLGSPSGTYLSLTAGKFYFMVEDVDHVEFNTSLAGVANANKFCLWYRDGMGGWSKLDAQKSIVTTTFDNNTGTLSTLSNNKYGVSWVYLVHNAPSSLHVVVGQSEYPDLASADAATPPASTPGLISGLGSLVGKVSYLKSATSFAKVYSAFLQNFGSSVATNHNGLSGIQGGALATYYHSNQPINTTDVVEFAGYKRNTATVSVDTSLDNTYDIVLVNSSAATRNITLPASTNNGRTYTIVKTQANNLVNILPTGADTVQNDMSIRMNERGMSLTMMEVSGGWIII